MVVEVLLRPLDRDSNLFPCHEYPCHLLRNQLLKLIQVVAGGGVTMSPRRRNWGGERARETLSPNARHQSWIFVEKYGDCPFHRDSGARGEWETYGETVWLVC